MANLYDSEEISHPDAKSLPVNTGLIIHSERGSALGRVSQHGTVKLVRGDREVFGVHGRSAEQRLAIDMLLDPEIGILSLGGRAGTGKSALALCAGLESVLERRQHKRIMVFRPLYAVGGQDLGFLPGTEGEK
jgi:PhoH-like ATPase